MNLNQVTLPAIDIPASVAFYKMPGLKQIVDSPHYARFECPQGDTTFSIHLTEHPAPNADYVTYFELDNLDEFVARLAAEGLPFDQPPTDMRWLWREARLRDPAGNTICLYTAGENRKNPPWRIN